MQGGCVEPVSRFHHKDHFFSTQLQTQGGVEGVAQCAYAVYSVQMSCIYRGLLGTSLPRYIATSLSRYLNIVL